MPSSLTPLLECIELPDARFRPLFVSRLKGWFLCNNDKVALEALRWKSSKKIEAFNVVTKAGDIFKGDGEIQISARNLNCQTHSQMLDIGFKVHNADITENKAVKSMDVEEENCSKSLAPSSIFTSNKIIYPSENILHEEFDSAKKEETYIRNCILPTVMHSRQKKEQELNVARLEAIAKKRQERLASTMLHRAAEKKDSTSKRVDDMTTEFEKGREALESAKAAKSRSEDNLKSAVEAFGIQNLHKI